MGIIGNIRKHSWIAVAVVGIAIVAFIIGDLTKNQRGLPDMGKINGTTITYQHFSELADQAMENYKRQQGVTQIPADVEFQLRDQVWQTLVGETLTDEQFEELGLTVSPAEVSDMYVGNFVHPYLRQAFTDPKTGQYQTQSIQYYVDNFESLDTAQRLQWLDLEKAVKSDRKQQKYNTLISRGFYMPNAIAKQLAAMGSELCNVCAVNASYQSVADNEVTLTDEDYKNYYNKHKAEFRLREELRELNYVVYPIAPTQQDMDKIQAEVEKTWEEFREVGDDEIIFFVNAESNRSYDSAYVKASDFPSPMDSAIRSAGVGSYISPRIVGNEWMMAKVLKAANRPDSIRASAIYIFNSKVGGNVTRGDEQAKQLADSVLNVVKSGAMTFEQAVAKYSDDPQKSQTDGDMEWQLDGGYGFLNEDVVNAVVGDVFVVRHPNEVGYFVVKVTGKTAPNMKYRVANIVRPIVPSEGTTRNIYNEANKFAGNNRTVAEMTAAAQTENLQMRNAMVSAMTYSIAGINNARSIVQWAYNEKTEKGAVADQIFEADDMYIVVSLKDIYEKGYATLDQARTIIENPVRIEKKAELLKARFEEAKNGAAGLPAVAAKMKLAIDTLDSVSFNDFYLAQYGMEPKIQGAIAASKANVLVGPVQGASGVYMFTVNAKAKPQQAADPAAIRSRYNQGYMQKMRGVQQVLQDNATIVDQRNKFF